MQTGARGDGGEKKMSMAHKFFVVSLILEKSAARVRGIALSVENCIRVGAATSVKATKGTYRGHVIIFNSSFFLG